MGKTTSKTFFDEDNPALGCINSPFIALPFNGSSLKVQLGKVEGIGDKNSQLFEDLSAGHPMRDSDSIAIFTDQYPGSMADEPMAFVYLNSVDSLLPKLSEVPMQIKLRAT